MLKAMITALFVAGFSGCATNPYGNYAAASLDCNQKMATATVTQLVMLYPPAHTQFNLQQPTTDAYGAMLVQAMRDKGYALLEYVPQGQGGMAEQAGPGTGLDLRYVVDALTSTNLYRVTVLIGAQSLSRAFTVTSDGNLYPAGAWIRQE